MVPNEVFLIGPWLHKSNSIYRLQNREKDPVLWNTPSVLLTGITPYSIFVTGDSIHLTNTSNQLVSEIKQLESCIVKEAIRRNFIDAKKHPLTSCIREWNGTPYIRLWIGKENNNVKTQCFSRVIGERNATPIPLTDISKGSLVQLRLWIRDFTVYQDHCELHLVAQQILLRDPLSTKKCLIDMVPVAPEITSCGEESTLSSSKTEDKYQKMLRMGIPPQVVEMKRKNDLLASQSMDASATATSTATAKPPMANLLGGILQSKNQLKKAVTAPPKKHFKKPNIPGCVPSLDEILQQRESLNKVSLQEVV
jgi:hypothetical protein